MQQRFSDIKFIALLLAFCCASLSGTANGNTEVASQPDAFLKIVASADEVYEGQAFIAAMFLYFTDTPSQLAIKSEPGFNGFDAKEISVPNSMPVSERIGDRIYGKVLLRRWIVTPLKAGKKSIDSGTLTVTLLQQVMINNGLFSSLTSREVELTTEPQSTAINVKKLPKKPKGFSGAVGIFDADVRLSASTVVSGESITLTYRISGLGNTGKIKIPDIKVPSGLNLADTQSDSSLSLSGRSAVGTSVYRYTIVPSTAGKFSVTIPEFIYFDPATAQYVTLPSRTVTIRATFGETYEM